MGADVFTRKPPPFDARLRYGADANQFGDLRLPKGTPPYPLAVNVHGGFWRTRYNLDHASHFCAALTGRGIATFNLEYRRMGNPGGGWPGSLEDLQNGLRYILNHADEHGIDRSRVIATGHSAGGQLALCLAAREPQVTAVVSLAGILDLERAWELHLSNDAVVEFLGGTPSEIPERYRDASPLALSLPRRRQLLIHGALDEIVPVEFSRRYARLKKTRGEDVTLLELGETGHSEIIDPQSKAWPGIADAIIGLLKTLGPT